MAGKDMMKASYRRAGRKAQVLVTFTWPADLPKKALWGTLPGQVASKPVHLADKKSKNCLWGTCSGGTSGQVNVTRLFSARISTNRD